MYLYILEEYSQMNIAINQEQTFLSSLLFCEHCLYWFHTWESMDCKSIHLKIITWLYFVKTDSNDVVAIARILL